VNIFDDKKKNKIFNYFLPIVAIGTVADVVPLI
jgi:single-stranded DNA-specific DHH superfamily exonuclease